MTALPRLGLLAALALSCAGPHTHDVQEAPPAAQEPAPWISRHMAMRYYLRDLH